MELRSPVGRANRDLQTKGARRERGEKVRWHGRRKWRRGDPRNMASLQVEDTEEGPKN